MVIAIASASPYGGDGAGGAAGGIGLKLRGTLEGQRQDRFDLWRLKFKVTSNGDGFGNRIGYPISI